MTKAPGRLIAVEGTNGEALEEISRQLADDHQQAPSSVSVWDASAIFKEVQLATVGAGTPSPRTLLLLYAADLAFRLRTDVAPALEAGRVVIAAPYVDTAIAFAAAAGLDEAWAAQVLAFAPRPDARQSADAIPEAFGERKGFAEFCCRQILDGTNDPAAGRVDLLRRTSTALRLRLAAS